MSILTVNPLFTMSVDLIVKCGTGAVDWKEETLLMSDSGKERTSSRSALDVNGNFLQSRCCSQMMDECSW